MGESKLNTPSCAKCVFATPVPNDVKLRFCRRVPPIASPLILSQNRPGLPGTPPMTSIQFFSSFASVAVHDWCGEFQLRPQVAGAPIFPAPEQNGEGGGV